MSKLFCDLRVGQQFFHYGQWYTKVREGDDGYNAIKEPASRDPEYVRIEPTTIVQYKYKGWPR